MLVGTIQRAHRSPFAGPGFIAGTPPGLVTVGGAPGARRVFLFDELTLKPVARTWSAADGTYRFDGVTPARKFVAVSFDHTHIWQAVIRDGITPKAL